MKYVTGRTDLKWHRNSKTMADKRYKEEEILERRFGRKDPRQVPEGYFDALVTEVMAKLPEQEQEPRYVEMTRWQKLKPYVYLAAMFAGIWLMMNIFGRVIKSESVSLENPPEAIAMAIGSKLSHEAYYIPEELVSEMQVVEDVAGEFTDMNEFQESFRAADAAVSAEEEYMDEI